MLIDINFGERQYSARPLEKLIMEREALLHILPMYRFRFIHGKGRTLIKRIK